MKRFSALRATVFAGCLILVAGCVSSYRNHGYAPTDDQLSEVKIGVDTRDTVAETIGTPSAGGVLDGSGYYYVRYQVRHYGARRPEVVDRQLVAITFNDSGTVRNIERFALEDGIVVPLSRRVTDNNLYDNGLIQQLLRNVGNFNPTGGLGQ